MPRRMVKVVLLSLTLLAGRDAAFCQQPSGSRPVQLRVLLPDPDVRVLVEDQETTQNGTDRLYYSPPLEPGKKYFYTVTMIWEPNNYTKITRVRKVPVQAGQEVVADLREADPQKPDKVLIRYVPTPERAVEAMCKLGQVGKDDVVFDLGCGDGRIVITAVKKFGAKRGVGVDIDPERIRDSTLNVQKEGVTDRVEIRQGDVLDIKDLSSASVVMLYMGDEMNLRLRPILQKTLKPGSRIVSHRFTMGDWKPVVTETVTEEDGEEILIHLWKIGEQEKK
jgi:uncharacterized protein (TIGR03000 family)